MITATVKGNMIQFQSFDVQESMLYMMPEGYSVKKMQLFSENEMYLAITDGSNAQMRYLNSGEHTFPIVNGKSPCFFEIRTTSNEDVAAKGGRLLIEVMEFGGVPDMDYFRGSFDPITVKSKKGSYKQISETKN